MKKMRRRRLRHPRPPWKQRAAVGLGVAAIWIGSAATVGADTEVTLLETPDGGIQPQALADADGTLHLLYFKGDAGAGDLFYVQRSPGRDTFSDPIRVNTLQGAAVAIGTVRGGQMALGRNGRVHIAWNGSARTRQTGGGDSGGNSGRAPMLYARLNDDGTAFEEQRNLIHDTIHLDGGGSVAADSSGNVYVTWHAQKTGSTNGEQDRKVWVARSADDGATFSQETPAWTEPTGACGCCGMTSLADDDGSLYMLYRSADGASRDIYLLASAQSGGKPGSGDTPSDRDSRNIRGFRGALVHEWPVSTCPMSTMALVESRDDVIAAWETKWQIYFARIKPGTTHFSEPQSAPGRGRARKHPAVAVNDDGEMILVWTEDTAWKRGGHLAWQVYDANGNPTDERGRLESAIPVWGLPTVVATDGGFTILH